MFGRCLAAVGACVLLGTGAIGYADPTPLFDGGSLAGWQARGESDWRVAGKEIVASGAGDGFLLSDGAYGDFRLRLEFWVDATTNSGVFIRCQDRNRVHPDTCYELNIYDEHPQQEARTGAIVFRFMPPLARVETVGRWNTYDIVARGRSLKVSVNGVVTARLEDIEPGPGFIALQHWGEGTVRFRNLQLQPL